MKGPADHKIFALRNEKGIVLPVVLMLLALLAAMGGAAVVLTRTDFKIAGNYKAGTGAFYLAEAGAAYAKNALNWGIDLDKNSVLDDTQVFDDNKIVKWDSTVVLAGLKAGTSGDIKIERDPSDSNLAVITSRATFAGANRTIQVGVRRSSSSPPRRQRGSNSEWTSENERKLANRRPES